MPATRSESRSCRSSRSIARRNKEALRAVVAGVDHPTVPAEAKAAVKAAIGTEADDKDRQVIKAIKMTDQVGKYED